MKRILLSSIILFFITLFSSAQPQPVKNVIIMIPDGTSSNLISLARWYRYYHNKSQTRLTIDNYVCGLVKTHCSNSPIGDSAPTTSCYMSGQMSQDGYISTYPPISSQDLIALDSTQAYRPTPTLFEAARILQNKSTGLVVTCEFCHATPADCSSHYYNREKEDILAKQIVHNGIDVVLGGGVKYLSEEDEKYLKSNNCEVIFNNKSSMLSSNSSKLWALFEPKNLPYDFERDTAKIPSLAEMTKKAISVLSKNEKGFILMVEGSLIDWAAHDNDVKTAITEMCAFDDAVKTAMEFANKNGETVVVIMPDHSNSGITMGNNKANSGYAKLSLDTILKPLENFNISIDSMTRIIKKNKPDKFIELFKNQYNIDITYNEVDELCHAKDYNFTPSDNFPKTISLYKIIANIINKRTYFGFTTFGHTGEDVFLAAYHPHNDIPTGMLTNIEIHQYLAEQMNLKNRLPELTEQYFVPHYQVFNNDYKIKTEIDSISPTKIVLNVTKGKHKMSIESYTNKIVFDGKAITIPSVIVYIDKNRTFYIPKNLISYFK